MTQIIDRRLNAKNKSAVNRQRFIRRFRHQIKQAVGDAISKRSITDIEKGEQIAIPSKDIDEPQFGHGQGGEREIVLPGNSEFTRGDRLQRPPQSGGAGAGSGEASDSGEGEDNFGFEITKDEFLDLFFEDLALPDLVKTEIHEIESIKRVHAGFSTVGIPANINIVRSLRSAMGRRIALSGPQRIKLRKIEEELDECKNHPEKNKQRIQELEEEARHLRIRINAIPYLDNIDIRYNNYVPQPKPSTRAVVFCLMDVSGSMDATKKDIAKRFFILLHLFLNRTYEHIEVVFIRHHTSAKEVDEEEFFYSRETGGTVVSSALELMLAIIQERYPTSSWNIYGAQASDGDNWNADSPYCQELLCQKIMPLLQYFAYVEILPRHHQSLWDAYEAVSGEYSNFALQTIDSASDIFPVLRQLFKKGVSQDV